MNTSILNIDVSCFASCQATIPKNTNLLTWLTSDIYRSKVEELRSIQDEKLQKVIKGSLPAITPSGVFSYRAEKNLIEHSGFLVFDIDFKDNQHITNFSELREQISHIASVAYCGLSVRGKGFWGLVPIPKSIPEIHKQRFAALANDFKEFGIALDASGKDVCRLRICSWDPDAYFNHYARFYTKLPKLQEKKAVRPYFSDNRTRVEAIIELIKKNKIDITNDYKDEWFKIASALANEFGESGRDYFHVISSYNPNYTIQSTDRMFNNVLKHDYNKISIGSFFKIASDYGLKPVKDGQKIEEIAKQNEGRPLYVPQGNRHRTIPDIGITKIESNYIKPITKSSTHKQETWDTEIIELEKFFSRAKFPTEPLKLNDWSLITDISLFVESNLAVVRGHNGNKTFKSYLNQLIELKSFLSSI